MKKLVEIQEVEGEGLVGLMGQKVTLFCLNYIYHGKLVGVNDTFVKLEGARLIYETGELSSKEIKYSEEFTNDWYVKTDAIESYGLLK